jgi:hypothetical protein
LRCAQCESVCYMHTPKARFLSTLRSAVSVCAT